MSLKSQGHIEFFKVSVARKIYSVPGDTVFYRCSWRGGLYQSLKSQRPIASMAAPATQIVLLLPAAGPVGMACSSAGYVLQCYAGRQWKIQLSWRLCFIHALGKGESEHTQDGFPSNSDFVSAAGPVGMLCSSAGSVLLSVLCLCEHSSLALLCACTAGSAKFCHGPLHRGAGLPVLFRPHPAFCHPIFFPTLP